VLESQEGLFVLALVVVHQIEDHSQRPNVRLLCVRLLLLQDLRTGKEGSAHQSTYHLVFLLELRCAEVCYFDLVTLDEYVGRLQISV